MKHWIMFGLAPLFLLAVACAKAPTDKLTAAEQAVNDARTAGAPAYMAEDFAKLESLVANAKKEIAEEEGKFAFLRDYEKAEQLLASAKADAAKVVIEAAKKKEEAKVAAVQAQQEAQASVKTTQALVAKAPVGKDRAAVEAIKADAEGLAASLAEVQAAMDAGDYLAAQTKAKAIQDKSQAVAKEIQDALAKVGGAKSKKGKTGK
ncbi:MAG: hypothetical protein EPO61_12805 [Nitrospirae bacterium]|nr:MAG: hypothetical protein EPO61_12805 [Nitrospirota bacterium]